MHSTKVIVSSSLMRKRLKEIIKFPISEVEITINKIVFHPVEGVAGDTKEIPCHSQYNHSPKIKFQRKSWEDLLVFLDRIPEQPVTFSYDVNDNTISLSGVSIGF
jgi:hypothetical protein